MKKLSYLIGLVLSVVMITTIFAQKTVVRQNGTLTVIYTSNSPVIDAYNAANNGDTIYIPGGYYNFPNISKRLVFIGAGIYPDSTTYTGATIINNGFVFGAGSDSTEIIGLTINGNIDFDYWATILKVKILRCNVNNINLNASYTAKNYIFIKDCILGECKGNTSNPLVNYLTLTNCIITNRVGDITFGGLIQNNLFIRDQNVNTNSHITNTHNSIIQNNVFYNNNNPNIGNFGNNNQILNNIFSITPSTYGTNFASGNYTNVPQSSILVNGPANTFSFNANYHLQSPSVYLGTDNTQVGIYGGTIGPFKEGAVPFNPHIYYKSVAPTTNSSGQLQIQFKVSAQTN